MKTWGLAAAKAQLSEVVEQAERQGAQQITRNGRPVAVLMSLEEGAQKKASATYERDMADFFKTSPLRGSGMVILRNPSKTRPVKF